jgi:hypothetical protein
MLLRTRGFLLRRLGLGLLTFLLAFSTFTSAQPDARIGELSLLDRQFMQQQRDLLTELTQRHFGEQFSGDRDRDLALLQRMLDERIVRNDQTRELQAMGVILGDLLAAQLALHWVIYEDRKGRSRALRHKTSDNYLFPITMISRRREVGNQTPVADIYRKAEDTLRSAIPALPFQ